MPVGVTVSHDGYIIISDKRDNRVMIFDQHGNITALFYTSGDIYNITIMQSDRLLIVNAKAGSSLVCSYDLNGRCIAKLGSQFTHDKPCGVAVTSSNNIIVTTIEPAVVYVLKETGKMIHQFRGSGLNGGQLKKPCNVVVNRKDEIIVSDSDKNCLKGYTQTGKFLYDIGVKPAQLKSPQGLCIDKHNNIIVADAGNYRVVKFNSSGKLVDVLVKETNRLNGKVTDHDIKPQNVAVTDDTLIVVLRGKEFAEVRLYSYVMRQGRSQVCACM